MSEMMRRKSDGGDYPTTPAGTYLGTVVEVNEYTEAGERIVKINQNTGEIENAVVIVWKLDDVISCRGEMRECEARLEGTVGKKVTDKTGSKSNLYAIYLAQMGEPMFARSDQVNLLDMLGTQAVLLIENGSRISQDGLPIQTSYVKSASPHVQRQRERPSVALTREEALAATEPMAVAAGRPMGTRRRYDDAPPYNG